MQITIFVRSNKIILGSQKQHNIEFYCGGGGCNQHSTYLIDGAVEDRLLEPGSMEIAQAALRISEVQYVDVGIWQGHIHAVLSGVWEIPTVVVDGVKHSGETRSRLALSNLTT